jgi:hypothetical protein
MQPELITINTPSDFGALLRPTMGQRQIKVNLPVLDPAQSAQLQDRLARLASPCGCTEGAIGLLLALLPAGYLWLVALPPEWSGWQHGILALGFAITGSLIGKAIGILRGRRKLAAEIFALQWRFGGIS